MPGNSKVNKLGTVDEYMNQLEHPLKAEIEVLRQIILSANDQIREEIKWNAPSFYVKEHFATFNLRSREVVQVIFHLGAKVKDNSTAGMQIDDPNGILEWLGKERCLVRFTGMSDITSKSAALTSIVNQWIQRM